MSHVKDTFLSFFTNQGAKETPEAPLITADPTVYFTNATIIQWKKLLTNTIPHEGVVSSQRCLRLHCLNDELLSASKQETYPNRFLGYFSMLGVLVPKNKKETIQEQVVDLLTNKYHLHPKTIQVLAQSQSSFIDILTKNIQSQIDTLPTEKYTWKYGFSDIAGVGATIGLLQQNGSFKEIGQLIELSKNNNVLGYEFGFGIETFITRKEQRSDYSAWSIAQVVPQHVQFKAYLDVLSCYGAAKSVDKGLLQKRHHKEIRRIARHLVYCEQYFNIAPNITDKALQKFSSQEFGQNGEAAINDLQQSRKIAKENESRLSNVIQSLRARGYSTRDIIIEANKANDKQYRVPAFKTQQLYQEL